MSKHELYNVWSGMLHRCYNEKRDNYLYYGGRGIEVCDRWRESFDNFTSDMGPRPEGHTLDRIDNDGNYSPENCKWSTRSDQKHNSGVYRSSSSRVRGVSWNTKDGVWVVRLWRNKKCKYGGRFSNLLDAVAKRFELERGVN